MARTKPDYLSPDNKCINGSLDFWQRATSFSTPSSNTLTADRFKVIYDGSIGTFSVSRQAFTVGQSSVPGNPSYFLRWDHTAAGSGSTIRDLRHRLEYVSTFAGKKATISFWMKADTTRTVGVAMSQNFGSGGSPSTAVTLTTQNISVTTGWQRFSVTFDVPSISGKTLGSNLDDYLEVQWILPLNVTMTIDIAQVMANEGVFADPFVRAGVDYEGEYRKCLRYFEIFNASQMRAQVTSSTSTKVAISYLVPKRIAVVAIVNIGSNSNLFFQQINATFGSGSNASAAVSSTSGTSIGLNGFMLDITHGSQVLVSAGAYVHLFFVGGNLLWAADAEL